MILLIIVLILAALYVLALRGRRNHPLWSNFRAQRFAHRGYHDKPQIPENSLPAFRRAIGHGWGAELDVHLLKDGTLAVFHDSDLLRCTGQSGMIEDLTVQELKKLRLEGTEEQVPLFDEVLALFEDETPLIIELKSANGNHFALTKAVCERLDSYRGVYCIESFDPFCLLDLKKLRPEACRGQLSMNFVKEPSGLPFYKRVIAGNMLLNFLTRPDFIAYQYEDRAGLSPLLCRKLWHIQEVSWTIRRKQDLLDAEREGSIAIFERFDPDLEEKS